MDLTQVVKDLTLTKVCTIKPDKDSKESKSISLDVLFDGVTLNDIFTKAISGTVIQWQNGQGRKKFDQWINKQTVKINFKSPAVTIIDPKQAIVTELSSMTPDEQQAYLKDLINKAEAAAEASKSTL